mgnify:CR=1 FL=1
MHEVCVLPRASHALDAHSLGLVAPAKTPASILSIGHLVTWSHGTSLTAYAYHGAMVAYDNGAGKQIINFEFPMIL